MNYQPLIDALSQFDSCHITEQAPMAAATTFKVGGPADLLIDLPNAATTMVAVRTCRENDIPFLFIGKGSNLVVGDKGFRGAVLRLDGRNAQPWLMEDDVIYAHAGVSLRRLCLFARDPNHVSGLAKCHTLVNKLQYLLIVGHFVTSDLMQFYVFLFYRKLIFLGFAPFSVLQKSTPVKPSAQNLNLCYILF